MSWLLSPEGGVASLDLVGDVAITLATSNDILQFDGSQWVDRSFFEAGIEPQVKTDTLVTSTSYTVLLTDRIILVDDDTAGAAVTINLPTATSADGRIFDIKKLGSSFIVTIDPNASETIDGNTTLDILIQYDSISLYSDGTEWHII